MSETNDSQWRSRLEDARAKSGMSMRAVSIGAKKGAGYYQSMLKDGKDPSIDNLIAICGVLDVSLSHILYGVEITPETEAIIKALEGNPGKRAAILQLLKTEAGES